MLYNTLSVHHVCIQSIFCTCILMFCAHNLSIAFMLYKICLYVTVAEHNFVSLCSYGGFATHCHFATLYVRIVVLKGQ